MTSFKHLASNGNAYLMADHLGNPATTLVTGERYVVVLPTRNMAGSHYPDLLVAFDVDPALYEASNGYIIDEQGKPPDFVLEIASRHTGSNDVGAKRDAYEALAREPDRILGVQWRLIRFLEARSGGPGMRRLADTDVDPNADITATFGESAVEGALGCHRHSYRAAGGEGRTLVGADGAMSMREATLDMENRCENRAPMSPQQRRDLDYLETAVRYTFSWTGW